MAVRAELIWEGKYAEKGKRVSPLRVQLPFQTVETVNESSQERQRNLFQVASQGQTWRNRLIWGDKKYVLPSLLPEFAGKVDLIYIDPPFDTGADFSYTANVPGVSEQENGAIAFTKQPSIVELKAYRDTWGRGLDSYLHWLYEICILLYELLSQSGSLYVHIEPDKGNYARLILDEIFGEASLRTEIAWKRTSSHGNVTRSHGEIWESIYYYTKAINEWTWNQQYVPFEQEYIDRYFTGTNPDGRRWTTSDMRNPGYRPNLVYDYKGYKPHWNGWSVTYEKMKDLDQKGRLYFPKDKNKRIRLKRYLDETPGQLVQNLWLDIAPINSQAHEALGYPTQKPEPLLERIVKSSSNEGDLVLDCFVGSGTTAAVAEKLNRRWIACDLSRFAIHTTRKRLLGIPDVRPFRVQNLGKYERQAWQVNRFSNGNGAVPAKQASERQRAYIEFILSLYQAKPIQGYTWLHGLKNGRMVHVGAVDAPVSDGDIRQVAAEFRRSVGTGNGAPTTNDVDVLGWDFAFELQEVARQQAAAANIRMAFKRIPREVMDKRAVEQGDIRFFELAALAEDVKVKGCEVTVTLTNFIIPPDDVPENVRRAVKHWSQWIDFWAIDWDYKGDTFHNEWQS